MSGVSSLSGAVSQYLTQDTVSRLFTQMGASLTNELTPNSYKAYLQVITWTVIDMLKNSFSESQLKEGTIKPLVDSSIHGMCKITPQNLGFGDSTIPGLTSRVIWYSLKLSGNDLV